MTRFVDYFSIIGVQNVDFGTSSVGDVLEPSVLQQLPINNWKDFKFPEQLPHFCFPEGWIIREKAQKPMIFCNALTDLEGNRCYYSSLVFFEVFMPQKFYIPKCLTLISRLPYFSNFKEFLYFIFYRLNIKKSDSSNLLEITQILQQLLYNNCSLQPGAPKFTLTMGEYNSIFLPPISSSLPTTDDCVFTLLRLIGIHNLITLYSSILLDNKIVFTSRSYTYLYKCTRGLVSLIYPIKYMYVYIPILPKNLIEILNAPTPYLVGVHSSCKLDMTELSDVLIMNLDIGLLVKTEYSDVLIPEPYLTEIQDLLVPYWHPELEFVDYISPTIKKSDDKITDKYIRACFFYLNLELLAGYRPCTTFARFLPLPIMKFHPSLFFTRRSITDVKFFDAFFKTTSFAEFINERGPTYRFNDYFDEMINHFGYIVDESQKQAQLKLINKFAQYFISNEGADFVNPKEINDTTFNVWEKIDFDNLNLSAFNLSSVRVPASFNEDVSTSINAQKCQLTFDVSLFQHDLVYHINPRRRLMISQCVELTFQDKMSEALKFLHAVEVSMTSKASQYELINSIIKHRSSDRTILTRLQIKLLTKLFNFILKEDVNQTCYSPAIQILKISTNFCQVNFNVAQFLYVHLQNHPIWKSVDFWVNFYFFETQSCLVQLYKKSNMKKLDSKINVIQLDENDIVLHPQLNHTIEALDSNANVCYQFEKVDTDNQKVFEQTELSFLYSLTIEILDKICCMLVNYDFFKELTSKPEKKENISAFAKAKEDTINEVSSFMTNFLFKVNRYVCLKNDQFNQLQELIKSIIHSQIDSIEKVCMVKMRSLAMELSMKFKPLVILENEKIIFEITGFLFYDLPKAETFDFSGSLSLLPAQGTLYLTTHRLAFVGQPLDIFLSDYYVLFSLPVKSLTKFKMSEVSCTELYEDAKFVNLMHIRSNLCHAFQFGLTLSTPNELVDAMKKVLRSQLSREQKTRHNTIKKQPESAIRKEVVSRPSRVQNPQTDISGPVVIPANSPVSRTPTPTIDHKKHSVSMKKAEKFGTFRKKPKTDTNLNETPKIEKKIVPKTTLVSEFSRMNVAIKIEQKKKVLWRISALNHNQRYSQNIPEMFIVPLFVQDDLYVNVQKLFRRKRVPVCTYVHGIVEDSFTSESKIFALFRSEAPLKMIYAPSASKSSSKITDISHILTGMITTIDALRQNIFKNFSLLEVISPNMPDPNCFLPITNIGLYSWHPVPLYVFYDRNFSQSNLVEKMSCVLIDSFGVIEIKKAFTEFQKGFCPSTHKGKTQKFFLDIIEESKWFRLIRQAFFISTAATFLGDVCISSTYFSFGDGVDLTSALSCLTQILIDPFYRTFSGFQKLIEKEWFEFNYNFYGKTFIEFIPIFLFFLDCVYQLTQQFPYAFEFNTYYLSFIAFHMFSWKFSNFLQGDAFIDTFVDDATDNISLNDEQTGFDISYMKQSSSTENLEFLDNEFSNTSNCIFKYISHYVDTSTVFHNLCFDNNYKGILYPSFEISSFEIWPLYYTHNFQLICFYNLETLPPTIINTVFTSGDSLPERIRNSSIKLIDSPLPENVQAMIYNTVLTYGYTGDGSPFVNDCISWMLHNIMKFSEHLGLYAPTIMHPIGVNLAKTSKFYHPPITHPQRFQEFISLLSCVYRLTETPKNSKVDVEKSDPNLHELVRSDTFYPCYCVLCGMYNFSGNPYYYCSKCGVFIHQKCQPFVSMICNCRLKGLTAASNPEELEQQVLEYTNSQLLEGENFLQGQLFTKKMLASWNSKFYVFNKKSHTLNVYNTHDTTNYMPVQSYSSSQMSNCKELKSLPFNVPKELQHVAGAFERQKRQKLLYGLEFYQNTSTDN